jgi:hypothetical protein
MFSLHTVPGSVRGAVAALASLIATVGLAGCGSSEPDPEPAPKAQAQLENPPPIGESLADVSVSAGRNSPSSIDVRDSDGRIVRTGMTPPPPAWYVTTVRDPVRGIYTAAVERQSLNRLAFETSSEDEPHALLALILLDGHPSDMILSLEGGQFDCAGHGRDNTCAVRVSIDGGPAAPVRFAVPQHSLGARLHLAGGADARRLLATLGKGKRLLIQPAFKNEQPADIEFALTGLTPAIAKLVKHSVAATQKLAATTPGA